MDSVLHVLENSIAMLHSDPLYLITQQSSQLHATETKSHGYVSL